jgi:hypothetical protein
MAMKSRAEKLGRMVSLMKLQLRLSEWQLAQMRQRELALQDEQVYLVGALNGNELPTGSSSESISRRLANTSVGARAAKEQSSRQVGQVQVANRRVKRLEQVAKAALADKLRETEKRSLEEMSDVNAGMRDLTSATR